MLTIQKSLNPAADAGSAFNALLKQEHPMLILISGGSALNVLEYVDAAGITTDDLVAMTDERFSSSDKFNNFQQFKEKSFFASLASPYIDSTPQQGEAIENLADRINEGILSWMSQHKNAPVIALMGVGADGHTAGIFPHQDELLFNNLYVSTNRAVVAHHYAPETLFSHRVTVTVSFFTRWVTHAVVLAVGSNKQAALKRVRAGVESLNQLPARILHEIPSVQIFTDQEVS